MFVFDHGLPLIALKEQRRELVMSLSGQSGPLQADLIDRLAAVQSAINAIESVIADLDEELSAHFVGEFAPQHVTRN